MSTLQNRKVDQPVLVRKPWWWKPAVLLFVLGPFVGVAYALVILWQREVFTSDLIWLGVMYLLTALGVTVGFHRMLTHRGFKAHPVIKFLLLVLGSAGAEGSALQWAATHLEHHKFSDQFGDPHSPHGEENDGTFLGLVKAFFHAHVGWLFGDYSSDPAYYCRYLLKDKMVVFVSKTFFLWVGLGFLIPFALDGWRGLLWGGLVRLFLTQHVTFAVNSVCHLWGSRPFATDDESHNQWLVGILAIGEGWHNNHHAFPKSVFHGLRWWEVDISGYFIWILSKVGLATDLYRPTKEKISEKLAASKVAVPDSDLH
jgi:stearoyl-CoA desaturase (delta-9 desaturase)